MITYNLANIIKKTNECFDDTDANLFFLIIPVTIGLDILLLVIQPLLYIIYRYINTRGNK